MEDPKEDWKERARNLSNIAWEAVKDANGGSFIDNTTPAGKLSELIMELAVHLGECGKHVDDQALTITRLTADLDRVRTDLEATLAFLASEKIGRQM